MSSYQDRKSHCGDKTVVRSSYLHNGISYTGKMSSLYWIRALAYHLCQSQTVTLVFDPWPWKTSQPRVLSLPICVPNFRASHLVTWKFLWSHHSYGRWRYETIWYISNLGIRWVSNDFIISSMMIINFTFANLLYHLDFKPWEPRSEAGAGLTTSMSSVLYLVCFSTLIFNDTLTFNSCQHSKLQ